MKRFLGVCIAIVLATASGGVPRFSNAQAASSWPMFHGDPQRNGISTLNGPTDAGTLHQYRFTSQIEDSPAVDSSGVAYLATDNGNVYAIDPNQAQGQVISGQFTPKWIFKTGKQQPMPSSPALSPDGKTLYIGSDSGTVYALATSDGHQIWSQSLPGSVRSSPLVTPDGSTVLVNNLTTLYALDAGNGSVKWPFISSTCSGFPTSPALSGDGGTVYIACASQVFALPIGGPSTGSGPTQIFLDDAVSSTPAVDPNGDIWVGTQHGIEDVVSPGGANPRCHYDSLSGQPITSSATFVANQAVFGTGSATSGGYIVYASMANCGIAHKVAASAPVGSSGVTTTGNGRVYIGADDGTLYGLDAAGTTVTGPIRPWPQTYGSPVAGSLAVGPNATLWFATRAGTLYNVGNFPAVPQPTQGPTSTPGPTNTPGPTSTPTKTPTPGPTSTATATATPAPPAVTIVSLKATVKPGQKQVVSLSAAPNTEVRIRVTYPNGDHQSGKVTTSAQGTATYSYKQAASKIKHNDRTATVTATVGTGATAVKVSKTYTIAFGKIDVSAEPRTVKVGQTVDIFVHAKAGSRVAVIMVSPSGASVSRTGRTGPKGFASIKYKIPRGFASSGQKVKVTARLAQNQHVSTSTTFTVK